MNELSTKAKLQRIIRTREGLEAFRTDVMKAHALGKTINTKPYIETYKLSSMLVTFLIKLGALEDTQPHSPKTDGKYLKWIYTKTGENGPVDTLLAESLIAEQYKYDKEYRRAKMERRGESSDEIAPRVVAHITPEKHKGTGGICEWLQDKLEKEEQIPGFLRVDERIMFKRICETLEGLRELQQVMTKIKL